MANQESLSKTEKCILKFKEVHSDRYNYDKVAYIKNSEKVIITCKEHGDFLQTPNNHRNGCNCPKCVVENKQDTREIIEVFREVHGDIYNYDNVIYVSQKEKVIITCKKHGDFLQSPASQL